MKIFLKVCDPKKQGKRLGAGALGFLDEFAEFGEPRFVGGEQAVVFFEGFEDGEARGRSLSLQYETKRSRWRSARLGSARARRSRTASDFWK